MKTYTGHGPYPRTIGSADLEMIIGGTDTSQSTPTSSTRGISEITITKSTDIASTSR